MRHARMPLVLLALLYGLAGALFVGVYLLVRLPLGWRPERIASLILLAVVLYLAIVVFLVVGSAKGWIPG